MIVDLKRSKLTGSRLHILSREPLGVLTLETSRGQQSIEVDEESANKLLDEVLVLFGVPRSPSTHSGLIGKQ